MSMRPYPSRNGLPLPVIDVDLPESRLPYPDRHTNNHHLLFPRKRYELGGIIYATLRDLESMQYLMPKDVHNIGKLTLHTMYSPPRMPKPLVAVDYICEVYEQGERLQLGPAGDFVHTDLNDGLMRAILKEAANLNEVRRLIE